MLMREGKYKGAYGTNLKSVRNLRNREGERVRWALGFKPCDVASEEEKSEAGDRYDDERQDSLVQGPLCAHGIFIFIYIPISFNQFFDPKCDANLPFFNSFLVFIQRPL